MSTHTSFFNGARQVKVEGSTFNISSSTPRPHDLELDKLEKYSVRGAWLNSAERSSGLPCYNGSGDPIMPLLSDLIMCDSPQPLVVGLVGPAHTGKTSQCQALAVRMEQEKKLLGCHFFEKTEKPERSDPFRLVPSLVEQLLYELPEIASLVVENISRYRAVFDQSPKVQFDQLMFAPLSAAFRPDSTLGHSLSVEKRLIIIDGLDHCSNPGVELQIVKAVVDAIPQLPAHIRILISTRNESHIRSVFGSNPNCHVFRGIDKRTSLLNSLNQYDWAKLDPTETQHSNTAENSSFPSSSTGAMIRLTPQPSSQSHPHLTPITVLRQLEAARRLQHPASTSKQCLTSLNPSLNPPSSKTIESSQADADHIIALTSFTSSPFNPSSILARYFPSRNILIPNPSPPRPPRSAEPKMFASAPPEIRFRVPFSSDARRTLTRMDGTKPPTALAISRTDTPAVRGKRMTDPLKSYLPKSPSFVQSFRRKKS